MMYMMIEIKQVKGLTFVGKGESNHWVTIDGPKDFFGSEAASRPMELLLIALGSCTASDTAAILQKKRVELSGLEIKVEGKRAKEHPKVFEKINIEYIFYGIDLPEKHLKRAIDLSQKKYCPIVAMLKDSTDINYTYRVEEAQ